MTLERDARDLLTHWRAPTPEQEQLRQEYAEHLVRHPDGLWRSCYPNHVTAGVLVLSHDRRQVLLNLHRKAGRWFHFGGHLESDDPTLAGAALREATEESGLAELMVEAEPLHLSRHTVAFCDPRGPVDHLDVRFLARLGSDVEPVASEESLAVRWWPVDALPTEESDMLELIQLALAR
ncbi:MAG: hydrolase [Marmoricola sp.]|nr:hydrolase [Marmoricola sp.]